MAALFRSVVSLRTKLISPQFTRNISISSLKQYKQIIEKKDGNVLTIEAKIIPDETNGPVFKTSETQACALCSLGFPIMHTDVLILRQFLRADGCVLPRRITGLCLKQQRRLECLVAMAQKAGLMSNLTPHWSNKDPKKRYKWKKYNTYFDENTIKWKMINVTYRE